MTHRTVIRFFSGTLLAALVLGCDGDSNPTDAGTFFEVSPFFSGVLEGTTLQLSANMGGQSVPVTWSSSNTAVATVSATGLVSGLVAGRASVTAALVSDPTQLSSSSITVLFVETLTSGTAVTGISGTGARGSTNLYKIAVPAGATSLSVTLNGGPGDVDLFMQEGSPPTNTTYDCSSENGGNGETCTITNPVPGTWFVVLYLWDPYSGVTLTPAITP